MALAERAQLVAELRLDDKLSGGLGKAQRSLTRFDGVARKTSAGLRNLSVNLLKLGAVAAVGIGAMVKSGLDSLATLESAVASVDGAIKQMGMTGAVTGQQIVGWANEIEAKVGAAFDDKAIVQATATLIRFGKVTTGNLRPAMQIITDLATKTGSVESAATLLAKALADPEKAAGKLARSGVVLTKAQIAEVKAFTKAGKAAEAQKVILDALSKTTKGAALASQGPYKRALSVLADVTEDAQRALAEGFLPVLEKVAGKLSKGLADPKVVAGIREFGQTLAGSLDSLLGIAERLPWGAIADSMRVAGAGAKTLLGAFTSLPPWVQTAVLTGWGLNKLTGGALGGIVAELGKGLIRGVLGINAGVVNVNAGVVNGAGGVPGVAPIGGGVSKLGKIASTVGKVFLVGIAAGVAFELAQALGQQSAEIQQQGRDLLTATKANAPKMSEREIIAALANMDEQLRDPLNAAALLITNPLNHGFDNLKAAQKDLLDELAKIRGGDRPATGKPATLLGPDAAERVKSMAAAPGVYARAVANGLKPTASAVTKTIERNEKRYRDAAAAAKAAADRTIMGLASLERTVANKNFAPKITIPVYVTSTVSVRNTSVAAAVNARYGNTRRIYEPEGGG